MELGIPFILGGVPINIVSTSINQQASTKQKLGTRARAQDGNATVTQ